MILSIRELVTWTGLGPFEASLHCFALCLVSILSTLRLTDNLHTSWHAVFVPLYAALALTVHFNVVLFIRMVWYIKKESWRRREKKLTALIVVFNVVGLVLLFLLEYVIAEYLEQGSDSASNHDRGLITMVSLFFGYFVARLFVVHRSLIRYS